MNKMSILFVFLIACGREQGVLKVSKVDKILAPAFESLRSEIPYILEYESSGIEIRIGDVSVETGSADAVGIWDSGTRVITVVEPDRWITRDRDQFKLNLSAVKLVLAHEIGHALGLRHSAEGLMTPFLNPDCLDREAECLEQALLTITLH